MSERVTIIHGDMREQLAQMDDCCFDACVTDPPYHLTSIVKRFGAKNAAPTQFGNDGLFARASTGFMGKIWDGGDVAFRPETWAEVLRVMKPGAHLVAFGGTRTFHCMACAIEDAGFEIRDTISYLYGSGFPKSKSMRNIGRPELGTGLKPAMELIALARKPLSEKTVAANVLRWGTGALNIDDCRIVSGETIATHSRGNNGAFPKRPGETTVEESGRITDQRSGLDTTAIRNGRWPSNVCHDGSDEVVAGFPSVGDSHPPGNEGTIRDNHIFGRSSRPRKFHPGFKDSGSAARFYYTTKADADDRLGSKHPTVKPVDLIQWLCRLVTHRGGTILDPFAGTGTTGEAAFREGMRAVLIEREDEYVADIRRRITLAMAGPDERKRESIKARGNVAESGPLFGGS